MKPGGLGGPSFPKTSGATSTPTPVPSKPAVIAAPKLGVPMMPADALAKLGIDAATKKSEILDVLGPTQLAPVPLVQVPGRIVYFNPELARLCGFDVPPSNELTPALEKQLIEALSYQVQKPGADAGGAKTLEGYADRYGGFGLGYNKGAGRAAFLPTLNANIKGVGATSLVDQRTSFDHRHGGAPMVEGFLEAIWGEVNTNIFASGSTRILAVIDNHDATVWDDGGQEKRGLIIRLGDQIRPAHLLDPDAPKAQLLPIFKRAAEVTGTLVTQPNPSGGEPIPDLTASMKALVERHARTSAEQFRYRVTHGALSPSNMELDGTQLDLGTIQSQPRTAPINTLGHINDPTWTFGAEHKARAKQLQVFFDTLVSSLNGADRARLVPKKVDVSAEMDAAYGRALQVQMLSAAGLKEELAVRLQKDEPKLVAEYTKALTEMAALRNDGNTLANKEVIRDVAVLDVFNLLRRAPDKLFSDAPSSLNEAALMELARPIVRGGPNAEKATRQKAERMIRDFLPIYRQVMERASTKIEGLHDDASSFMRSVTARAAFENEPMEKLFRADLKDSLRGVISTFDKTGDRGIFKEAVDKTIAASLRDVDGLLAQGGVRTIAGGIDIERRTIDGIDHAVRALDGGKRRLLVDIPLSKGGFNLDSLADKPKLNQKQAESMRYRFTTDGWKTFQEAPAKVTTDEDGRRVIRFEIPVLKSDVGRLEGVFHITQGGEFWMKDGASNFRGYTFAVPDDHELKRIKDGLGI